jgi:hypothetical protein
MANDKLEPILEVSQVLMECPLPQSQPVRFGLFELDVLSGELRKTSGLNCKNNHFKSSQPVLRIQAESYAPWRSCEITVQAGSEDLS